MSYQNLLLRSENGIAYLTINRPDKLNAFNKQTISELHTAFSALDKDASVRAIILTGSGEKAFVAGADISVVAGADISEFAAFSIDQGKALSKDGHDQLFDFVERLGTPVIAAVNGFALGGGLELAMSWPRSCSFE